MQRNARAPNFFHQRFATGVDFVQVRRTKWLLGRSREDDVTHLQIAHRPIVRGCKRVEFLCDAQRRFPNFVVGTDVSDDDRINRTLENHERVIAHFYRVGTMRKRSGHHNERIGRADQETEFFQRVDLRAQFRDCVAQIALARGRRTCQRVLIFCAF
jgi:hypothetical protein